MKEIREQQLKALDVLGKRHAEIGKQLDELTGLTNDFDIEAKIYFIAKLAQSMEKQATAIHGEMHTGNSADHPHLCEQMSDKGVFDFIFGKRFGI